MNAPIVKNRLFRLGSFFTEPSLFRPTGCKHYYRSAMKTTRILTKHDMPERPFTDMVCPQMAKTMNKARVHRMTGIRGAMLAAVSPWCVTFLSIASVSLALPALAETGPSFDCDMAGTKIEKQICGSPALAVLDRQLAEQYTALQKEIQSKALRNAIVADQRAWLKDRNACGANTGAGTLEACLGDAYRQRRVQLVFHRSVFVGPPLPHPFRMKCQDIAINQVEMRACLQQALRDVGRTLSIADQAAMVEMKELDDVTSAGISAQQTFVKSRQTFDAYREAACWAVAASYAGGSGAGIAALWCQRQLDWERANRVAVDFLFRQNHWSENLETVAAPIRACLKAAEEKGPDPRITALAEAEGGGRIIRIATGDAWRGECSTTPRNKVVDIVAEEGTGAWPNPPLAVFYPEGSRIGPERLERPPDDPCSLYRWVTTPKGKLSGWLQLSLCQ